ncbi:hypothetical protein ACP4OV_008973 [Aristida adscensionis]
MEAATCCGEAAAARTAVQGDKMTAWAAADEEPPVAAPLVPMVLTFWEDSDEEEEEEEEDPEEPADEPLGGDEDEVMCDEEHDDESSGSEAVAARTAVQGDKMTAWAAADEEPAVAAPLVPMVLTFWVDSDEEEEEEDDDDDEEEEDPEEVILLDEDGLEMDPEELVEVPPGGDEDEVMYDEEHDDEGLDGDYDEEADDPMEFWDEGAPPVDGAADVATVLEFLGSPTSFATAMNTAGFMRLAAEEAEPGDDGSCGGEIVVRYRHTSFRWRQGTDESDDVEMTMHPAVRFLVPFPAAAAADLASSLRLAGASLASIVYPAAFCEPLQALWASLAAVAAATVAVPPRTARLVVTVDAAILRRRDRTPERMASMHESLPELARVADADAMALTCLEDLLLPAPVRCDDEGTPPAKSSGEECAICYEALDGGLAAWPRCSHVFHGKCLEQLLIKMKHCCPLCRSGLDVEADVMCM